MVDTEPLTLPQHSDRQRRRWPWVVGILALVVYAASIFFYNQTLPKNLDAATISPSGDGLAIYIAVNEIDNDSDRVTADLIFTFGDDLVECTPVCNLAEDLTLFVPQSTTPRIELARGTPIQYSIPTVLFLKGAPYTYPFDVYASDFSVIAKSIDRDRSLKSVPVIAEFLIPAGFVGWQIQLQYPPAGSVVDSVLFEGVDGAAMTTAPVPSVSENGETWAVLSFERAASTKIISILILGLMVVLACITIVSAFDKRIGMRENHVDMATWLTATLFAMPALRALLPGSPPLGSWIDILVFFWVEIATMITLVVFVFLWVRHTQKGRSGANQK